jgi:hypothetical protein
MACPEARSGHPDVVGQPVDASWLYRDHGCHLAVDPSAVGEQAEILTGLSAEAFLPGAPRVVKLILDPMELTLVDPIRVDESPQSKVDVVRAFRTVEPDPSCPGGLVLDGSRASFVTSSAGRHRATAWFSVSEGEPEYVFWSTLVHIPPDEAPPEWRAAADAKRPTDASEFEVVLSLEEYGDRRFAWLDVSDPQFYWTASLARGTFEFIEDSP